MTKVNKGYQYIPFIMTRMLHARMEDIDVVGRNVSLNSGDPLLLAPTIAAKLQPSSRGLHEMRRSRFILDKNNS